jgi:hypothetical protein
MKKILIGVCSFITLIAVIQCSSEYKKKKLFAEKYWGSERTCLPCHEYQQPIARNHNYRCDTCHRGDPFAKTKEVGHKNLISVPQDTEMVTYPCHKCHLLPIGKTVPYDAQFVQDIIVSHK